MHLWTNIMFRRMFFDRQPEMQGENCTLQDCMGCYNNYQHSKSGSLVHSKQAHEAGVGKFNWWTMTGPKPVASRISQEL